MSGVLFAAGGDHFAVYALGGVGDEDYLHGHEHQFQVEAERLAFNVHQVEFQLVVGGGVVLAHHLRVACQTCLDLESEAEFGHTVLVLFSEFGAFGAGAYERHIAFKYVEQLRQFIEAYASDYPADGGDAVIVLVRELCAVLFGVDYHAAELIYVEFPAAYGKSLLFVEHGAFVVSLDGDGRAYHEGRGQDYQDERQEYVESALDDRLVCRETVVSAEEQGSVEQVALVRASHEDVREFRVDVGADVVLEGEFHQLVFHLAGDVADNDRLMCEDAFLYPVDTLVAADGFVDDVLVHAAAHFPDEGVGAGVAVDYQHLPRRI